MKLFTGVFCCIYAVSQKKSYHTRTPPNINHIRTHTVFMALFQVNLG